MPRDGEEMTPTRPGCEAPGRPLYYGRSPPPTRRPSIWGLAPARAFRDGIDVHKRDSQIYILAQGREIIERRIRTEPERFTAVLGPRPGARILIEASTDSEWVARCLEALGHEVIVELRPHLCHPLPHGE